MRALSLWTLLLLTPACTAGVGGGSTPDSGASTDAGSLPDAQDGPADGRVDAGGTPDSGLVFDGGSADAGTDASALDATTQDSGPSRSGCSGSTAMFCEDFEGLAAGPANSPKWTKAEGNGSLVVDSQQARGSKALHVHTNQNGYAFLRIPIAPAGNSFFGRMYLYVTEFPSAPDWAHFTLAEATGTGAGFVRPVGGQYAPPQNGGGSFWGIGSDGGPTGDWTDWRTSAPTEAGRWLCVEFRLDATDNQIQFSIDGVTNDDLTVSTRRHGGNNVDFVFPVFDRISIGWQLYQGGPTPSAYDLWIDDLVLDDAVRPACP